MKTEITKTKTKLDEMEIEYKELHKVKAYIEEAKKILIVSHIQPDPDALCSSLGLYNILKLNGVKDVFVTIENATGLNGFDFLKSVEKIEYEFLDLQLEKYKPDLIIFTDGESLLRFSRGEGVEKVEKYVEVYKPKIISIDHHSKNVWPEGTISINNKRSSCSEEIYEVFVNRLGYKINKDIAEILLLGILMDTSRFLYYSDLFYLTAPIVTKLLEYDLHIEPLMARCSRSASDEIPLISELYKNIKICDGYTYSYLSDEFISEYVESGLVSEGSFVKALAGWRASVLRGFENNHWGFIVHLDYKSKDRKYKVSFRSTVGFRNVLEIVEAMGVEDFGGHENASGCYIEAESVDEVVKRIEEVVSGME